MESQHGATDLHNWPRVLVWPLRLLVWLQDASNIICKRDALVFCGVPWTTQP